MKIWMLCACLLSACQPPRATVATSDAGVSMRAPQDGASGGAQDDAGDAPSPAKGGGGDKAASDADKIGSAHVLADRAARAKVVIRARLVSFEGGSKYVWQVVEPLEVIKNETPFAFDAPFRVANYSWDGSVPEGISTLYLEPYGGGDNVWRLLDGSSSKGISHADAFQDAQGRVGCMAWRGGCLDKPQALPRCDSSLKPAPMQEILDNRDTLVGKPVAVVGPLNSGAGCTEMGCSDDNPCCNRCTGTAFLGQAGERGYTSLQLHDAAGEPLIECKGDESLLCCEVEAKGQEVVVQGTLVHTKSYPSGYALQDAVLCAP